MAVDRHVITEMLQGTRNVGRRKQQLIEKGMGNEGEAVQEYKGVEEGQQGRAWGRSCEVVQKGCSQAGPWQKAG